MDTRPSRQAPPHLRRRKLTSRITIPDNVSPHVKLVFSEMQRQAVRYEDAAFGAGVNVPTIKAWRRKNRPSLESLDAVLGWLGWNLIPVPRAGTLPVEFEADLRALAERADVELPAVFAAVVAVMAEQRATVPTPANDDKRRERVAA
ncbi:hypothetical protein [Rhodoplanes elegans]|nr:hypothetical protein [Rhodoplanes elegans]